MLRRGFYTLKNVSFLSPTDVGSHNNSLKNLKIKEIWYEILVVNGLKGRKTWFPQLKTIWMQNLHWLRKSNRPHGLTMLRNKQLLDGWNLKLSFNKVPNNINYPEDEQLLRCMEFQKKVMEDQNDNSHRLKVKNKKNIRRTDSDAFMFPWWLVGN